MGDGDWHCLLVAIAGCLVGLAAVVAAVVVVVVGSNNRELAAVVLGTSLGNGHDDGLVVGSRRQGAHAEVAGGKASGDHGLKKPLAVASIVDTLEEGELGRTRRGLGVQALAQILDRDVSVADDVALAIQRLGGGVVRGDGIGEGTGLQTVDLNRDVEVLALLDLAVVRREEDDGRDHLVLGGNITHGYSQLRVSDTDAAGAPGRDAPSVTRPGSGKRYLLIPLQEPSTI